MSRLYKVVYLKERTVHYLIKFNRKVLKHEKIDHVTLPFWIMLLTTYQSPDKELIAQFKYAHKQADATLAAMREYEDHGPDDETTTKPLQVHK